MSENNTSKICVVCGRQFKWRKKWKKDWQNVKFCSQSCKKDGINQFDLQLEKAIIDLLHEKKRKGSICPSEATRRVAESSNWRKYPERTRRAARRLAQSGKIMITQQGKVVDPTIAKGPIRLKLI